MAFGFGLAQRPRQRGRSNRRGVPDALARAVTVTPHVTQILINLLKPQLRHQVSTNQVVED
jgi:ribose 1,5-bisphosphokinase PhnN